MHQWLRPCHSATAGFVPESMPAILQRCILLLMVWGWMMVGLPAQVRAADPLAHEPESASDALRIDADRFSHDLNRKESTAQGHVTLTFRNLKLQADQVTYNQDSSQAWALGRVQLFSDKDILSGERLLVDLQQETGTLFNGSVFIAENHVYLTAAEIIKTGPDTYEATQATITTCDGPDPDWRITGKRVQITLEGYGTANHMAFWAGKVPLLYSPYFVFPAKTRRQTGLLIPEFAYSQNRKGAEYRQPFFWAINDSSDATFYADASSLRGLHLGAEYRYALDPLSFGTIMIGGLNDNEVDDGRLDSSERWGYPDDEFLRPNSDRYWLRAKADQQLPGDVLAKLDLDLVSDQDYLHEFRAGRFGFAAARNYFRETFGRDIDDEYDIVRLNQLNLNKTWRRFSANGDLRWNDNVVQRRQHEIQDTIQQLPSLQFSAAKQPIASLPVYYHLDTGYDYFFRRQGADAHRADMYAAVSYPLRLLNTFSTESTAGLRQTAWSAESGSSPDDLLVDSTQQSHRSIYNFNVNINTEPYRIYQAGFAGGDRIKHIIKPQLVYEYVSDPDQSELPYYDSEDRLTARNRVSLAITNTLISRLSHRTSDGQPTSYRYIPFLRFNIEESYDFSKSSEERPFSDLLAELDLTPGHTVAIDADTTWSPYDRTFTGLNAIMHLWDTRGDILQLSYHNTRTSDDTSSIKISGLLSLTNRWRFRAMHERNLKTDATIETGLGISYLSQCWALDLDYVEEPQDSSIAVTIQLTGLGKIRG